MNGQGTLVGTEQGLGWNIVSAHGGAFMSKQTLEYYMARFRLNEEGATAVEYGVLVALIIAILVVTIAAIGQAILGAFQDVETAL
jgi:pilus assembly protein Flp/PilA